MKEIKYNSGGQPFYIEDDQLQQVELYKAIENQFLGTDGFVFSGCVVTGNAISAGLVYLDGKIREIPNATGLTFPSYIKASSILEYESRLHTEDNQNKTTRKAYNAEITTTLPVSGNYITITATGCSNRIRYELTKADGQTFGKTYVKASSAAITGVTTTPSVFTTYTEQADELNEFNATTGEFTAQKAGLYLVAGSASMSFDTGTGGQVYLEKFSGSWATEIAYIINFLPNFLQNTLALSCIVKLAAGEKLRISTANFNVSTMNAKVENLNITNVS